MLTIKNVANHWDLSTKTVERHIRDGQLPAYRKNGAIRLSWPDVWSCEEGRFPKDALADLYKTPLLSKRHVAKKMAVSIRTVETWMSEGLPIRRVFTSVRFNRHEICPWLSLHFGREVSPDEFERNDA